MTSKKYQHANELPILLDSIYCLHRIGDHSAANALEEQSKALLKSTPTYKSLSQLLNLIGKYQQTSLTPEDILPLEELHADIISYDYCLFVGWSFLLQAYLKKKKDLFEHAVKAFQKGSHFNELYETFYWMDKHRFLPVEEKIHSFLRLYPSNTVYSKLMGNTFNTNELVPQTEIEKKQLKYFDPSEMNGFDCWLIQNQSIAPANYHSIAHQDESFLDLYSGLINDRGEYLFLLIGELNCLAYLISAQLTGAKISAIAEFLDRTEEETIALVQSLKNMGFPVTDKQGVYFLEWQNKPAIIVPRSLKVVGLQEYVRKKKKAFTKAELIELLQLTQYGAEALLRKWALAGHIRPVENPEKATIWKFV